MWSKNVAIFIYLSGSMGGGCNYMKFVVYLGCLIHY